MTKNTIRKKKPVNKVTRRGSISKGKSGNYRKKTMKNRKMNMNQTKRGGTSLKFKKGSDKAKRKLAKKLSRGLSDEAKSSEKYKVHKESKDKYSIKSLNDYFKSKLLTDTSNKFDLFPPNAPTFTPADNLDRKGIIDYKEFLRRIFDTKYVTTGWKTKKTNKVLVINTDLVNFWSDNTKVFKMNDDGSHNTILTDHNADPFVFDNETKQKGLNMRDFNVFRNAYIQHIIAKILTHNKGKMTSKDKFYNELRNIASASNVQYLAEILGNYYGKFYFSNQNENHLNYKNVLGLILKRYIEHDKKKEVIKYKNHISETKFSNELNRMLYYIFTVDTDDEKKDDEIKEFLECFQKSADAAEYDNTENVFTHYKKDKLRIGGCRSEVKFKKNYENEYKETRQEYVKRKTETVEELENRIADILKTFNTKKLLDLQDIEDALSIFSDDDTFLSIYPETQFKDYIRNPVNISPEEFLKNVLEQTNIFFETVTDKKVGEAIRDYVIIIRDNKIGDFTLSNGKKVKDHINTELEKCTNEFLFEDKFLKKFDTYFTTSLDIETKYEEIEKKIDECTTMLKKLYDVHKDATEMGKKFTGSNLQSNMNLLIEYLMQKDRLVKFIDEKKISTITVTMFTYKVKKMLTVTDIDTLELQINGKNEKISDIKSKQLNIAIDDVKLEEAIIKSRTPK